MTNYRFETGLPVIKINFWATFYDVTAPMINRYNQAVAWIHLQD
jgi:hypothetical protein